MKKHLVSEKCNVCIKREWDFMKLVNKMAEENEKKLTNKEEHKKEQKEKLEYVTGGW